MNAEQIPIWGGIESTVNRVGDQYYDQLKKSGHEERISDLELFAELGLKQMRYPAVLWERVAPDGVDNADWSWSDKRLERMKDLDITPIVGFLHHGSGPLDTSLVDPRFADKLEEYATAVARRYPDLEFITPINEINTTARFSGLYGLWYPHAADPKNYLTALFNQCEGTVRSMEAVRKVNPSAKLVTTEDMGKVFATPQLKYQADFENDRRFWSYDLLTGNFDEDHMLWDFALHVGMKKDELQRYRDLFAGSEVRPDVMGINYYVTSERWIDHRLELFPESLHGGNGKERYVDTEAVRVPKGLSGIDSILHEVWERYQIPIAITEAHLGCTVDEQMRWFRDMYEGVEKASKENIDVQAVTVWALLGLYDWNSLVTKNNNHYESAVFNLQSGNPQRTDYAEMIEGLIKNKYYDHEYLDDEGWWNRKDRILYEAQVEDMGMQTAGD